MKDILIKAIAKWGIPSQLEMAQEEATELALACRKFNRKQNDRTFNDLASEVADTEIMIAQIKLMFPNISHKVSSEKAFKIDRLEKRINANNHELESK